MISFSIQSLKPTTEVLKAYLYQFVNSDFIFYPQALDLEERLKTTFNTESLDLCDFNNLKGVEIQRIFSEYSLTPKHFYCFNAISENALEFKSSVFAADYRQHPPIYTNIHQVSFEKGGLISLVLFEQHAFTLCSPTGKVLLPDCHDILLGVNGKILYRLLDDDSGSWKLADYNGVDINFEGEEEFGALDAPVDFPDLEDRDRLSKGGKPVYLNFPHSMENYIDSENVIRLLEEDPYNYRCLGSYYENSIDLAEKAVLNNKLAFTLLSNQLQNDEGFVRRLLLNPAIDKNVYNYLPPELKQKEEFIGICLENNPRILANFKPIHSKALLLRAFELGQHSLFEYASEELRSDKECIKKAISKNWKYLKYVSKELIFDEAFFTGILVWYNIQQSKEHADYQDAPILTKTEAIRYLSVYCDPFLIRHIAPIDDIEIIASALQFFHFDDFPLYFPKFLGYVSEDVKADSTFWLRLLKERQEVLDYIPTYLLQNKLFATNAVQIYGEVFNILPEAFRNDADIAYQAIFQIHHRKRGYIGYDEVLSHMGTNLMQDTAFIRRLLPICNAVLKFLNDEQKEDEALFLFALENTSAWVITCASIALQNKLEFVLAALKINPEVFNHLPDNMKLNAVVIEVATEMKNKPMKSKPQIDNTITGMKNDDEEDLDELPF